MPSCPTRLCRTKFSFAIVLSVGSALFPLSAYADDQSESLELMEKQIARIQEQQAQLTQALVGLQKQLVAKKARLGTSSSRDSLSRATRQRITASNNAAMPSLAMEGEEDETVGRPVSRRTHNPDVTPRFVTDDIPTFKTVTARRAEDIIVHTAENNVGPHARESVGAQAAGAVGDHGVFHMGPVTIALGGFVDTAAVLQDRQMSTGTFTYWAGLPYKNSPNYHTNSFEGGARYSRLSLLLKGNIDEHETISGFFETDFGAGAATTNAYESNSYSPRLRQAYLVYDNSSENFHFLAGQAWSMLTPGRIGIVPRQESLPETIDAAMLAGQTWARQWQIRLTKDFFKHKLWVGLSIENPQTLYDTTGFTTEGDERVVLPNGHVATINKDGTGLTNSAPFSNEIAPDVIAKVAYDPKWGHYEIEGIAHFAHDRVSWLGGGHNYTEPTGGGGGSMILPVIPHKLEIRIAGLAGYGIGRYGSVLLPDATINAQGKPQPLFSAQGTAGLVGHLTPRIDVYGFFGTQWAGRSYSNVGGNPYGYGNPLSSNAGCNTELSALPCTANIHNVMEGTVGAWWRFLKGRYGTVQVGAQLSYSHVQTWNAVDGHPHTSESQLFFDFRYLPFQ